MEDESPLLQRLNGLIDEFVLYRAVPLLMSIVFLFLGHACVLRAVEHGSYWRYLTITADIAALVAFYMVRFGSKLNEEVNNG